MAALLHGPHLRPLPEEQEAHPRVAVQPAQPVEPVPWAAALPVIAKVLKILVILPLRQAGQRTSLEEEERWRSSNRSRQALQEYSKIGIAFISFENPDEKRTDNNYCIEQN